MWIQNKIKKGSMCYRISIKLKCINESLFLPALATQLLLASAAIEMLVSAFTSVFVVLDAFGGRSIHHIGAWPRRGTIWHWRSGHILKLGVSVVSGDGAGLPSSCSPGAFDSSESTVWNPQTMPANPACPRSSPQWDSWSPGPRHYRHSSCLFHHNVTVQITSM